MIRLTNGQLARLATYRDRYWRRMFNAEPADRSRAEAAALRLAEIGGVQVRYPRWVSDPNAGSLAHGTFWGALRASLSDSLRGALRASLSNTLRDTLRGTLDVTLDATLRASLLCSLSASLWDTLRDSAWVCHHTYAVEVLGIPISDAREELLTLHNELAASCFALWITPGQIVLCDRPAAVEIEGGKLIGITWRD